MQEDVAEDEVRDALLPEMPDGAGHRLAIVLHAALRHKIHDMKRYADPLGLREQQRLGNAVHRRAAGRAVGRCQQRDDLILVRLHRPPERMGRILAAAPVEHRFFAFHIRFCSVWFRYGYNTAPGKGQR